MDNKSWPPNYIDVWKFRQTQLIKIRSSLDLLKGAKEYYSTRPAEFITHWLDTYDPRNASKDRPIKMPFVLFPKQVELVEFIMSMHKHSCNGLIEKCRDMGATWVCCGISTWFWTFKPGISIGWGSRKSELVDRIGDMDGIFEKMRFMISRMPKEFWPKGFMPSHHMGSMKIINPESGSSITGEGGDNIGRGGRKTIYFKDESAHYVRPEKIEASLGDNTNTQIDVSSVNGPGNVFHRKREAGIEWHVGEKPSKERSNIFIMDWRDHPDKDEQWYNERKARYKAEGLLAVFYQEVDRNYLASRSNVLIPHDWVNAAVDAHIKLGIQPSGKYICGFDPFDEGSDEHALCVRRGFLLENSIGNKSGDTAQGTAWAIKNCPENSNIQYDSVGIGAGVKAEANRLKREGIMPKGMTFTPWKASFAVQYPDKHIIPGDKESPKNKDHFENLKAQAGWELRRRFERTYKAVELGEEFDESCIISIDSKIKDLNKLKKELSQPLYGYSSNLKLIIEKTPSGTVSPNRFDSTVQAFFPVKRDGNYNMGALGG